MKSISVVFLLSLFFSTARSQQSDSNEVKRLQQIGFSYSDANPDSNLYYQQRALTVARKIKYKKGEIKSIAELGFIAIVKGNYASALELSFNAKKQSEEIHNDSLTAEIENNIALCYYYMGDFVSAKDILFHALTILEKKRFEPTNTFVRGNLGRTYLKLNDLDSALLYCIDAYRLFRRSQVNNFQPALLRALGEINEKLGKDDIAFAYYEEAVEVATKMNLSRQLVQSYQKLAESFFNRKQNDSALVYAIKALSVARDNGFQLNVMEAANFLSTVYEKEKKTDSAYINLALSVKARNELFNQERQNKIKDLIFSQVLNELEIDQKNKEAQQQRSQNLQFSTVALCILVLITVYFIFSQSTLANPKLIRFFGVLILLVFFEYLNLLLHPYLSNLTHHSPPAMLTIMVCIAAMLIPLHHRLEHWIIGNMIDRNNRLRLKTAKKIIKELEG